jgi:hypothetical protein
MFLFRAAALNKPASQRMTLTSTYTSSTTTATQVTSWTADGSYPATNIVSNALVVDKAGTINITSNAVVSGNSLGATVTASLHKNATSISSASTSSTGTLNLNVSGVAVSPGDTIAMYVGESFGSTLQLAATTTFITIVSA